MEKTALALVASLEITAVSCAVPEDGGRADSRCRVLVHYRPPAPSDTLTQEQIDAPELVGSFNGWARPGRRQWERIPGPSGLRTTSLHLPEGTHQYAILVGDRLLLDDRNPQSTFVRNPFVAGSPAYGVEVSQATVPNCLDPDLLVLTLSADADAAAIEARFVPSESHSELDPASVKLTLRRGDIEVSAPAVSLVSMGMEGTILRANAQGLQKGKYTFVLQASDRAGHKAQVRASTFVEERRGRTLDDGLVYHLMVDRFRGDRGPLTEPKPKGDRLFGTLRGVQDALRAGYFASLGVTTLWLSPVYENPQGKFVGRDGRTYEAYHGYWPKEPRAVEPAFGGEPALRSLLSSAHELGIRVILDAVPNHVHETHPYYSQHSLRSPSVASAKDPQEASWFHDGLRSCVCGGPGCGWGERIEDCWFDRYLPDLNWRHPEVRAAGIADLLYWADHFDLDGFRIDAVPMMPRAATRAMVRSLRQERTRKGLDFLLLGETYTASGDWGRKEIRSFLGERYDGLSSQFDFPLMWSLRQVIARGERGLVFLEEEIAASDAAFAGSGATIAHILDNHDTSRFLSEAAGDAGGDPWTDPPAQPAFAEPYDRQILGLTLLLTLPGLPVIYYGDEVGLAGASDPDSRRPLPDVLSARPLPEQQGRVLRATRRLGTLRRCAPALRRGQRIPLYVTDLHEVVVHKPPSGSTPEEPVIVALSLGNKEVVVEAKGLPPGNYRELFTRAPLSIPTQGAARVYLAPLTPALYLPEGSSCLQETEQALAIPPKRGPE